MKNNIKTSLGFSLVELMVSLVAGLIVIGAVGAFMMSSFRSNADFVAATRLTQELRNSIDFISRELRRAGYDETAVKYVALPDPLPPGMAPTSHFAPIRLLDADADGIVDDECVIYAYDRTPGNPGKVNLFNGEIRGVRRKVVNGVGVIEFAESSAGLAPACDGATATYTTYPASCNAASGWCALSDPRVLNISEFTLNVIYLNIPSSGGVNPLQVRDVTVRLKGNLVGDTDVSRTVESSIRIRADCMKATANCSVAPVNTPTFN